MTSKHRADGRFVEIIILYRVFNYPILPAMLLYTYIYIIKIQSHRPSLKLP